MFHQVFVILILLKITNVDAGLFHCNSKSCRGCIRQSYDGKICRWCNRDSKCHKPRSTSNPCKKAENVLEESHCNDKFSRYDPQLSMKMLLLSAAAYDEIDPQECLSNSLTSAKFEVQDVVTLKCDNQGNKCSLYWAISHVFKAIVIAFRGSVDKNQALNVFLKGIFIFKEAFLKDLPVEVQQYWDEGFKRLWSCSREQVTALVTAHPDYQVWVTGHSLGGAMASLASTWLSHYKIVSRKNLILYTFGMPRVGSYNYAYEHDLLVNNSWRVVNYNDAVPHYPTVASINILLPGRVKLSPYHHGIEAYYTAKATSANSKHRECHGKPYNEDFLCSFTTIPNIGDFTNHRVYFSIPVGTYWTTRCQVPSSRKKRDIVKLPYAKFQYKSSACSRYKYRNGSYFLVSAASKSFKWFHITVLKMFVIITPILLQIVK